MSLYFSEKLRELRGKQGLTQEQLADMFHVSPQSVSRWETGTNYPDVELLPHLAIFFKVSVDELLGTEKILGEEKAKEYRRDIRNLLNAGKIFEAIAAARRAVKEYPVHHDLQCLLLRALCTACSAQSPASPENKEDMKREIFAFGERILNSNDQSAYADHKYFLIRQYAEWGMKEEAKKFVDTLPEEAYHTQDLNLSYVLEGEAWQRNQKLRIIRFTIMLCSLILGYAEEGALDTAEKIACLKAAMQIEGLTRQIAEEEEDDAHNGFLNIRIAELYCEAGDAENALDFTERAAQDALRHTDSMYQTNADGSNYYPWATPRNLCWILWEDYLMKAQFDSLRDNERFVKCFDLLQAHAQELKQ